MRIRTLGSLLVALLVAGPVPVGADTLIVYPAKGQSAQQQARDEGECQGWAKQTTGVDPLALANAAAAPPPVSAAPAETGRKRGGAVRGAAGGAVAGAAIGAIAGDAGKGAAIGAVGGGVAGGARRRRGEREAQAAQADAQAQAQQAAAANASANQEKLATFNKAYGACLEGKGYTVK